MQIPKLILNALGTCQDFMSVQSSQKAADLMVNNFSFKPEPVAKEVLSSSQRASVMEYITIAYIYFWAEEAKEWRIDGRNSLAARLCRIISNKKEFSWLYHTYFEERDLEKGNIYESYADMAEEFVRHTEHMHNTLMQTFTGFIFAFIDVAKPQAFKDIAESMRKDYSDKWYRLPLI